VHGRGEHGRRYGPVAESLKSEGIECTALDLRGFGRTVAAGRRAGRIRRFDEYLLDIEAALDRVASFLDQVPVVLLGHRACWRAYREDPLTVRSPTARWFAEVLKHQRLAFERAKTIKPPVLILQGGADTSSDPKAAQRFSFEVEKCIYKEYAGCFHEVLNEPPPDRERIFKDLAGWVIETATATP